MEQKNSTLGHGANNANITTSMFGFGEETLGTLIALAASVLVIYLIVTFRERGSRQTGRRRQQEAQRRRIRALRRKQTANRQATREKYRLAAFGQVAGDHRRSGKAKAFWQSNRNRKTSKRRPKMKQH